MFWFSVLFVGWISALICVVVLLTAGELLWIIYCRTLHPLSNVPGSTLASFSRLWLWKCVGQGNLEKVQLQLHRKYGHLVRIAPNEISCSDSNAIKEIYKLRNPLAKSDFYTVWQSSAFGTHMDNFSVIDEKVHSERRRIVNHIYTLSNILQSENYIDDCSRLFIKKLGEHADKGQSIDLGQWLQMYAFDVIGELYFGSMFGFMQSESDYEHLIESLDILNPLIAQLAVSATYARPFILLSSVAFGSVRSALKAIDHVSLAAKNCVNTRKKDLESSKSLRQDLLQQLFAIHYEKGEKVDFGISEIQYESYTGLFAGSDTTAIAMRSILYHLSREQEVLASLLTEIDTAFPASQYPLSEPISYADAINLPLLCATVKEAMRLHPAVGFTMPRVSPYPQGLTVSGQYIPPGHRIGINAHVVQRDRTIFGEDAESFKPQRWLPENTDSDHLLKMENSMLHFGAGTRTCIGKNISLSEIHKLIPQLLRNFDFEPVDSSKSWTTHNYWFNKQTGLNFNIKRRVA